MEVVQEKIEGGQEAQARIMAFEPEILAFCCEH
jgi:hypothetical protein